MGWRLLYGVAAGLVIGVLDLWFLQFTARGLLAGLAAGVAYGVLLAFVLQPGMGRFPALLAIIALVAGAVGGLCWWFVAQTGPPWAAPCVGAVLALVHFAGTGAFAR
jgi:hypothetical protein